MHRRTMTLYRTVTIDELTSITTRVNVLHLTGLVLQGIEIFQRFRKGGCPLFVKYYLSEIHKWLKARRKNSQFVPVMF
jgi:hypothetical protein